MPQRTRTKSHHAPFRNDAGVSAPGASRKPPRGLLPQLRRAEASKTRAPILIGLGPAVASQSPHYSLKGKCCDKIVPLGLLHSCAHAWTTPKGTTARAIAVNSRRFKKNTLPIRIRLYSKHSPDRGLMRKASRPPCSAPAAASGVARCRYVIPFDLARRPRGRVEEGRVLPATAWAGLQSGRFGEHRDGRLPSLSWHAGQHGVSRVPEGV